MFEQAFQRLFAKMVDTKYPHIRQAPAACAKITAAAPLGADSWTYSLKLLTESMAADSMAPEIPGVKSKVEVKVGDTVAVVMLYGGVAPFIVGEVL